VPGIAKNNMPAGMGLCTYFFQLNQLEQSNLCSN